MWIQIRTMDGKRSAQVDNLSKLTRIDDLKKRLVPLFDVEPVKQRLFYRGKQLEDGHTIFDYDVGLNDIIQLMVRVDLPELQANTSYNLPCTSSSSSCDEEGLNENSDVSDENKNDVVQSQDNSSNHDLKGLYKVNDMVDAKDCDMGAWFEAKVVGLSVDQSSNPPSILYHVIYDGYEEDEHTKLHENNIRPRASLKLSWEDLNVGQVVMANYNTDEPKERGFWYDVEITRKEESSTRKSKKLFAKLILCQENDNEVAQECKLLFIDEIFKIPSIKDGAECSQDGTSIVKRQNKPDCSQCKDDPLKLCKLCACCKCGGKDEPDKQILCDECDMAYHIQCLKPPLLTVPDDDEWYCPSCKNDASEVIKAGEKLRANKKKQKMASANSNTERDWGRGMACVGRTKQCTVVPSNHFGAIPGIPVGSSWLFRIGASEAGVHRPHVSGIHGRDTEGAFSIVLAGGYEDDLDRGEEFLYTGSGGRDLSGNKRTAEQTCDQILTRMNKALARNCAAPLSEKGKVTAKDWKAGKPVRVIRSSKFRRHSTYAPEQGNRYDGLYKVVEYWSEKGQSGYLVRRYLLRRDDEEPAPWTPEGKARSEELGLTMQYPEGYKEAQEKKRLEKEMKSAAKSTSKKRKRTGSNTSPQHSPAKKKAYTIANDKLALIKADTQNQKIWKDILASNDSITEFHKKVEEAFQCICCQELASKPITTECKHNTCKVCLNRSFKAGVFTCPMCRFDLGKDAKLDVNTALSKALQDIFPGYDKGR
ncbi:E3 ubiquitin-protein ligase UHRF1-like [Dendronephthya gigantea]|uniref:E3 ubiquitin-protein ligase UHRF1-like n=1 Tax=Dendronephthya gigantea TaxID=151771 RepID=UPI00106BF0FA|nr:E3 ubiquitin-protein ligase UHRF1-like [Dendronephthya gigantea]